MTDTRFDNRDGDMLHQRIMARDTTNGPRIGDYVNMPDGSLRRFTHDWGDTIQTTTPKFGYGSYYLGTGYSSYSGALDPGIPKSGLKDTGNPRDGAFWFFHHDYMTAHNGVDFTIPCRVFQYRPAA